MVCPALWDQLQRFNQMLDIDHGRLGTRPIVARKAFQEEDLQTLLDPMEDELQRVGASQYYQRELRDEVGGSTPYDVQIIALGPAADDGYPLPLDGRSLRMAVESCTRGINAFEEAPANTDLDEDIIRGQNAQSTVNSTAWARTSSTAFLALFADVPVNLVAAARYNLNARKPSHVVVFGADGFHLCSSLRLLRHGLLCRHYFAVLLRFIGGKYEGVLLRHDFDGNSVHNRWRKSPDGSDEPWTVSRVLDNTVHGNGWDGCVAGDDHNYWGPTFDDQNNARKAFTPQNVQRWPLRNGKRPTSAERTRP